MFDTVLLQMARPQKNKKSGVYYLRQKTPVDLMTVFGKKEANWTLGTKEPEDAKAQNVLALRKQGMIWATLRKRPELLPLQQIVALSGIIYRDPMAATEAEPA